MRAFVLEKEDVRAELGGKILSSLGVQVIYLNGNIEIISQDSVALFTGLIDNGQNGRKTVFPNNFLRVACHTIVGYPQWVEFFPLRVAIKPRQDLIDPDDIVLRRFAEALRDMARKFILWIPEEGNTPWNPEHKSFGARKKLFQEWQKQIGIITSGENA